MFEVLNAAWEGLLLLLTPERFTYIALGTGMGLMLGAIPGLGGVVGIALLLPFVYSFEPIGALTALLAVQAVIANSDTVPSVLFGVPGSGSMATIIDGHALAKQGQAGRALGAAYMSNLLGGFIGGAVLLITIPLVRPLVLAFGAAEYFALALLGLSMVAVLAGSKPLKGLVSAFLGLLLGFVGVHAQTGFLRWDLGTIYLWDGISFAIVGLGVFAIPELWAFMMKGTQISDPSEVKGADVEGSGISRGMREALHHKGLILRTSLIGSFFGAMPGVGGNVIDWFAYAHGKQTAKDGNETFGKGDIRGVIAPEGANVAKEGAALLPTLAFGVPGTNSMAMFLLAMLAVGIPPGPELFEEDLPITFALAWSLPIANVLAVGAMLLLSTQLIKLVRIRIGVLAPILIVVVFVGAYQSTSHWGDLILLVILAIVGFGMKITGWPRPPFLLGFVLANLMERYLFIAVQAYGGVGWLLRPIVMVILAVGLVSILFTVRLTRPT